MFASTPDGKRPLGSQDSNLDLRPPKGPVLPLHHSPSGIGDGNTYERLTQKSEFELVALQAWVALVLAHALHAQRAAAVADQRLELLELGHRVEGLGALVVRAGHQCSEHALKSGRPPGRLASSLS